MKKYAFLFACCFWSQFALGQNTSFTVKEIDSIVKNIDSVVVRYGTAYFFFGKKRDKEKPVSVDWVFRERTGSKLLNAVRETLVGSRRKDTYYFYKDSLIYLKISKATYIEKKTEVNCEGQYYFQNSTLIFKQDDPKFNFDPQTYLAISRQFLSAEQILKSRKK
jgi:hypothetical protein